MALIPTASQTAGPFFHLGLTRNHPVACMASPGAKGERIWLHCRVLDGDGEGAPVKDAMLELWQADADGVYADIPQDGPGGLLCTGFGRLATDENGECVFETVQPGCVPGAGATLQAPHINVSVFARGLQQRLATRIYFAGAPANANDPILALVPADRRETLMAQRDPKNPARWIFEIRLCGERETVFFDV